MNAVSNRVLDRKRQTNITKGLEGAQFAAIRQYGRNTERHIPFPKPVAQIEYPNVKGKFIPQPGEKILYMFRRFHKNVHALIQSKIAPV